MSEPALSIVDRLRERMGCSPTIFIALSAVVLILLPLVIVWLEGYWEELFSQHYWRAIFVQPVIIIYILILERVFKRMEAEVIKGLGEVVQLSEQEYEQLVDKTAGVSVRNELLAFLMGVILGLLVASPWDLYQDFSWLILYITLVNCLMYGLLGWVIYASIAGTRLPAELYRQPLEIDIFNIKPFEPIGRQSLAISLAFMGGIAISLLFSDVSAGILTFQFWAVYLVLVIVAVLVFFLNMMPTHRVLTVAKKEEMDVVMQNLREAYRELIRIKVGGSDVQTPAEELNAWKISQEMVNDTNTWPYSIETLRNLLITVLIPGAAALVRLLAEIYFD